MGRGAYSDRWTVEESKSITTKFLKDHKYFDNSLVAGNMSWSRNGEKTGSISFTVSTIPDNEYINFKYTITSHETGEKKEYGYKAPLTATPCNFGGKRWWFICPLTVNGKSCNRRVAVLYLANGQYFGCRHCYNLTYTSSKENHKFDNLFKKLGVSEKEAKQLFL